MPETNIDRPLVIDRIVSWRDCDPTGAVYPPRFLDVVAEAVEAWFRHVLAHDWYGLQRDLRLALHVFIEDVGRSSLPFRVVGYVDDGNMALRATMVISIIDLSGDRPTSIPDDLRTRIRTYQEACTGMQM